MKYLNKKFIRDIKILWPQFLSVLIMAMISVTIYSGMSVVWTGMNQSYEDYAKDSHLSDAFVWGSNISEKQMGKIRNLNYVNKAEPSMAIKVLVNKTEEESDILINTFSSNTLEVMNPVIRSGKPLDSGEGIWLDEDYANAHALKAGDKLKIYIGNTYRDIKINGTALQSENIFFITSPTESIPNHQQHGYAYISEAFAKELFGKVVYNQARVQVKPSYNLSKEKFRDDMSDILGADMYSSTLKEDKISIAQVRDEQAQIKKMAILFSAVFILLSILSMYTTMSRLVNNQIVQIGTMKSLGYSNSQIYFHYGLYGFLVALIGSIGGMLAGYFAIAKMIMGIKQSTLTLPQWNKVVGIDCLILILIIIFICTISSLLTVRKVTKTVPALTIRGISENKVESTKELKKSRMSYKWLWSFRAIKVHPVRYFMAVIAVIGSIVLMVAGIGIWDSLSDSYSQVFERQYDYQYAGNIQGQSYEQVRAAFGKYSVQLAKVDSATFSYKNKEKEGVFLALDAGHQIHLFEHGTGKSIDLYQQDAVITYKMAQLLHIKNGDVLSYTISNTSELKKIKITAIADAKLPQGIFIARNKSNDFIPNTIYFADSDGYSFAKDQPYISGLISIDQQKNNMDDMMESVHSIMYILIFASLVLSAVILYSLGILTFIERYREYATMKVLGFYEKEIAGMVFIECCLNLIPGLVVGIPLSIQFLKVYVNVVSMDNMEWTPYVSTLHFGVILGVVIMFSVFISLLVCGRIKRVNMVEALKSVE